MRARILLAIGVLLVLVSAAWRILLPQKFLWDDARAVELTNASDALHETMHAHGHEHDHDHFGETDAGDDPEVVAAAKRYQDVQGDLDSAKFWSNALPVYLRWTGLAACCVGLAAYYGGRQTR